MHHKITSIYKELFLAIGIILLVLNFIGIFIENKIHPKVANINIHKNNLYFKERDQAKERVKKLNLKKMGSLDVSELNQLFAKSIVHFWPDYNHFSIYENWLLYFIQKTEVGLTNNNFFGNHERLDWEKTWESGFGLCSQISIALYDYLIENGQQAYLVALDGHVVVSTIINGNSYIMDPDYNVVFKANIKEIEPDINRIKDKYLSAGYSSSLVENIVEKYNTSENNKLLSIWDYYPKYLIFSHFMSFLKWVLPALFVSLFFFRKQSFYLLLK